MSAFDLERTFTNCLSLVTIRLLLLGRADEVVEQRSLRQTREDCMTIARTWIVAAISAVAFASLAQAEDYGSYLPRN